MLKLNVEFKGGDVAQMVACLVYIPYYNYASHYVTGSNVNIILYLV